MDRLGSNEIAAGARVVVAMSGGVDSSVAAALLKAQGHDVVGITLQLYDQGKAAGRRGSCCAGRDVQDARRVAEQLGIPHYVLDYENRFAESVMADFVASYRRGETPIPCVSCNQKVKFRDLLGTARDIGARALATGHYVRRVTGPGGVELHRARDRSRDQSYFLFTTTSAQLDFLRFPLGDLDKAETRRLAEEFGLAVADKPDSQDICFVPDGKYAKVIERLHPGAAEAGAIVDLSGRVIGQHDGIIHYTIGQRRGLPGGAAGPLYVVRLDAARRQVVVGPRGALEAAALRLREVNWLLPPGEGFTARVKIRSTQEGIEAHVRPSADGGAEVIFAEPQGAVAPGQACVFYQGERVLGGGWIEAVRSAAERAA